MMAILRCKMCGGDLEIIEGSSSCTCEFCGTVQTIPTVKDEGLKTLFNRANVLRMKSEFDKASEMYEKILQKSESESEAYWGLILCKYGIEYVEDPNTYKRIPTCHRASFDAVTSDEDYKNALKYADAIQRKIYEEEAKAIDEVQKGIIALAQKEDPYDVFICYKETDENGNRTQDSVIANDIYYQLTQEGFKVFYAAITLEDKLGSEYEPHIFSALNTAKVMLSLGTKPEYFNAVWVKNEWSRFLKIMKKDRSKMLIPCYRDMDAYELPEEFSHLQAQDMSKIGFITDLIRGIKKVIVKEKATLATQETVVVQQTTGSTTAIAQIKRGNMALEDQDWAKADSFFEEALNLDPECAEAYVGKLLAREKKVDFTAWVSAQKGKYISANSSDRLEACPADDEHINKMVTENCVPGYLSEGGIRDEYRYDYMRFYRSDLSVRMDQKVSQMKELSSERLLARAKQYAKGTTLDQIENGLNEIEKALDDRILQAKKKDEKSIEQAKQDYAKAVASVDDIVKKLNKKALEKKDAEYLKAVDEMNQSKSIGDFKIAIRSLLALGDYKDCSKLIEKCKSEINLLNYQDSVYAMNHASEVSDYRNAKEKFLALGEYKDSADLANMCQKEIDRIKEKEQQERDRQLAMIREAAAKKAKIHKIFTSIAIIVALVCIAVFLVVTKVIIPNNNYNAAVELMNAGKYEEALDVFSALGDYKDGSKKSLECETALLKMANIGDTVLFGAYEQDNDTANGTEALEWIVIDKDGMSVLLISKYALDCQRYNSSHTDVSWETCSLRTWMNGTFLDNAFSADEQSKITTIQVDADKNPEYSVNPGNSTMDKVFLLGITEAERYLTTNELQKCAPTAYAIAHGAYIGSSNVNCWWWLRSRGCGTKYATYVSLDGAVIYRGEAVFSDGGCVRPAMWINLEDN